MSYHAQNSHTKEIIFHIKMAIVLKLRDFGIGGFMVCITMLSG
jgi:hypothetical protein